MILCRRVGPQKGWTAPHCAPKSIVLATASCGVEGREFFFTETLASKGFVVEGELEIVERVVVTKRRTRRRWGAFQAESFAHANNGDIPVLSTSATITAQTIG